MAGNSEGKSYYGLVLDNGQLRKDAQQASGILKGIGNSAEAEGARIDSMYKKIVGFGSGFLVLQHAKEFISQIVKVRGEIESLSISFETLLGSKQKADALFSQIKEYASKTPLELSPLAKGAQTLLSFNVEAEKVMPILKQIGDISMGSSDKFNSLTLAFSQMYSAGKLMGNDLLQMINAGFNPLSVMAEKTGKSIAALKDEMSAGAISADMVADAFRVATEEGGKFHGMLDKQSKGIEGSLSNLSGAIDDMMNDLGTKGQGIITSSIAGATAIVENYEKIGKVIMDIVVAYGAYKAALLTLNAIQNVNRMILMQAVLEKKLAAAAGIRLSNAEAVAAARTKLLSLAQHGLVKALNAAKAAMLSNPYTIVAVAVATLAFGIYKLATAETVAETAQRKHNEAMEAAKERKNNLISKTQQLVSTITDETQTIYENIKAWKELQKEMPEAFAKMTIEEFQAMKPEERDKLINKATNEKEIAEINKAVNDAQKRVEVLQKELKDKEETASLYGSNGGYISFLKRQVEEAKETLRIITEEKKLQDEMIHQADYMKKTDDEKLTVLKEQLQKYQAQYDEIEKQVPESERIADEINKGLSPAISNVKKGFFEVNTEWGKLNWQTQANIEQLNFLKGLINEILVKISGIENKDKPKTKNKQFWEEQKKEAETARDALDVSEKNSKEWNKYTKQIAEAQKQIDKYSDKKTNPKDYIDELRKNAEEESRLLVDLEFRKQQSQIEAMKEGLNRELAELKLNHEKKKEEIKREGENLLKTYTDNAKAEWKAKGSSGKFENSTFYKEANSKFDKQKPAYSTDDENPGELWKNEIAVYNTAVKKATDELINKYQDYATQRLAIEKKFNDDIATLHKQRNNAEQAGNTAMLKQFDSAIAKATADRGKELITFDFNVFKESPEYVRAFEDLKNTSTQTLNSLLSQLEKAKSAASSTLDPSELKEYTGTIQSIIDELNERDPFAALARAKEGLAKADEELAKAKSDLDNTVNGTPVIKNIYKDESTGKLVKEYLSLNEATKNYNKALDNQKKKQNEVTKSTNKVLDGISNLSKSLEELGRAAGGEIGEIISLVGNIGNVVTVAIQGMEAASAAGTAAMKVVESASVILTVVSAVIQVATKIADLLGSESTGEKYEDAKQAYESYIDILDRIIDKHLELAETLAGKNAQQAYEKAIELINTEIEATRKLGREYLDPLLGPSSGLISSKGSDMRKNMSYEGWSQAAQALGVSVEKFQKMMGGAMDNLFNLSDNDLQKLATEAPLFLSQLDSETQNYFNKVIELLKNRADVIELEISKTTLLGKDTLRDDFLEMLSDMDSASEDFADSFEEHMKRAALNAMLKKQFSQSLEDWRKMLSDSLDDDGEIDETERDALRRAYQDINKKMIEERENLDDMFDWSSGDSERKASSKGVESISQDSADKLNGMFTAFTGLAYSINENTKILVVNNGQMLKHLAGIESNTKYCENLEDINKNISSMKSGIDDINLKGITIKK